MYRLLDIAFQFNGSQADSRREIMLVPQATTVTGRELQFVLMQRSIVILEVSPNLLVY